MIPLFFSPFSILLSYCKCERHDDVYVIETKDNSFNFCHQTIGDNVIMKIRSFANKIDKEA